MPNLDVSSRWNSTYLMLESAIPFRTTYDELRNQDKNYKNAPSLEEWERAQLVCNFLEKFYDATLVVPGSSYPIANRYMHEF